MPCISCSIPLQTMHTLFRSYPHQCSAITVRRRMDAMPLSAQAPFQSVQVFFWFFFLCSHAVFLFCMFVLRGSSHRWSGEDSRVQGRHFYYDVQHGCRRDSIARFGAAQGSSQTATAKVIARRYVFFLLFYFFLFLFCLVAFILKKLTGKKEREREVSIKERLFMWFFFFFLIFL